MKFGRLKIYCENNRMYTNIGVDCKVPGTLGKSQIFRVLIDTGASLTILSKKALSKIPHEFVSISKPYASITGEEIYFDIYKLNADLNFEGLLLRNQIVGVHRNDNSRNVLGNDILNLFNWYVDNDAKPQKHIKFAERRFKDEKYTVEGFEDFKPEIAYLSMIPLITDTEFENSLREYERKFMFETNHTLEEIQEYINKRG